MPVSATFRIRRPAGAATLVYDTPHSGREYPADWDTRASRAELRRGEDACVDELLAGAPALGACLLEALVPRCYVDLNRLETDIDAALLAEPWPTPLTPSEKTIRGLGLIRRFVVPGVEINARALSVAEVRERIERVYRPYHAALRELVDEVLAQRGTAWHVNWHSMKSLGNAMTADGPGAKRADFVVSDREGASAGPQLMDAIVGTLRSLGYRVSVNDPYKGGTIVQQLGAPERGVHSVQVEINRALYLDEAVVEKSAQFSALAANLDRLTATLASLAPTR